MKTRIFTEVFEKTLDSQLRLAIPSQWRTEEGESDRFVVMMMPGSLLRILPAELFQEKIMNGAGEFSLADVNAFGGLTALGSRMRDCPCDRQGRIQLSTVLTEYAGIKEKVILAGAVNSILLTTPEQWKHIQAEQDEKDLDILDRIHKGTRKS